MSTETQVQALLEPVVAALDVELLDVELNGATLRVTVDNDEGITSGRLADVNRLISPILDQHDPIAGRYTLEVTSPGLERPLRRADHYRRAIDEDVVIKLVPDAGTRRVKGRLVAVHESGDDTEVEIDAVEIDGVAVPEPDRRRIPLADVASARTIFEWGPSPKPGGPKNKPKNKKNQNKSKSKNQSKTSRREVRDEQ